jgi:hypothetical protein
VTRHGKVADRSAIIALGSRNEPRRSGMATRIAKVDKALVPPRQAKKAPPAEPTLFALEGVCRTKEDPIRLVRMVNQTVS